jgi:hypothetical protein
MEKTNSTIELIKKGLEDLQSNNHFIQGYLKGDGTNSPAYKAISGSIETVNRLKKEIGIISLI